MYKLAILYDITQRFKPSDPEFLEYFRFIASQHNIQTALIGKHDIERLGEFNGLFIRATTERDHYTYQFALEAKARNLAVLDHPDDIWKCTSKLLQHELFLRHKIEYPISKIISIYNRSIKDFGYPYIVKTPDSAFSRGVFKINNRYQFNRFIVPKFHKYPHLLMQEYLCTTFDWRIGVLAGKPLFAIKYYIIPGDHRIMTEDRECDHETVLLQLTSPKVIDLALRACKAVGQGLYGVDIKIVGDDHYVLEVNDNPSIDRGIEDEQEGDAIYNAICNYFIRG